MVTVGFPGAGLSLFATWLKVELDVKINNWFGDFYNLIQKALSGPNNVMLDEYMAQLATLGPRGARCPAGPYSPTSSSSITCSAGAQP